MTKTNSRKEDTLKNFQAELVNVVGGSNLNRELNLLKLQEDLEGTEIRYEPEVWAGLYVQFGESEPAILVFSSGKYNIAGAKSVTELENINNKFISRLSDLGIAVDDDPFEVRNQVYLAQYDAEFDLNSIAVGLRMENTEYEPEQFPGVFYNNPDEFGTFLIFRTGKIVLTGVSTWQEAESAFRTLYSKLDNLLTNS